MLTDLMIDLETLSTTPQTAVVSLGAYYFNPFTKERGPTFYMILDLQDQIDKGREISASTLKWWMGQEDAAKTIFHEKAKPTIEVLNTFVQWFTATNKTAFVWGNGSTFDISIMENLFRDYGVKIPWGYNKVMDLRTFKRFCAPEGSKVLIKSGVKHNALDDAQGQAEFVMENCK
jgi:hypothetical protein